MDKSAAIDSLAALAQPMRLDVYRLLVVAGPDGMTAGAIADALDTRQNTMSANLAILTRCGLIARRQDGRHVTYTVQMSGMRDLLAFLMQDCCGGRPEMCQPVLSTLTCGTGSAAPFEPVSDAL